MQSEKNNALPLELVPKPVLLQKAKKVTDFGPSLRLLADQMVETMRKNYGMGLAAPQVNRSLQLVVAEYEPTEKGDTRIPLTVLVNPTITDQGKDFDWMDEGCLSLPGVELPIKRPTQINVLAQDLAGNRIKIRAKDLYARILQHEIDHTNGVLITKRAYPELEQLKGLRILFMGTPAHTIPYITALAGIGADFIGVVTETDKPVGRKQQVTAPPAKLYAVQLGLPIYQFDSLKDSKTEQTLRELAPDLVVVVAYGKLIPKSILAIPRLGFLNIHYSLLPQLRGPSPHQTALLEGLKETGFTIFKLDEGMDTGPILTQKSIAIRPTDTSESLIERLVKLSVQSLLAILPDYANGTKKLRVQDNKQATYTRLLTKQDGQIDWAKPVEAIERQIRALYPWPGSYTVNKGERLLIHEAHLEKDKLILDTVQLSGGKAMSFQEFLRGKGQNWLTFLENTGKVKIDHH